MSSYPDAEADPRQGASRWSCSSSSSPVFAFVLVAMGIDMLVRPARSRAVALPRAAHLARARVRPPEVPDAAPRRPRARCDSEESHARMLEARRGEPDVGGAAAPQAVVPRRAAAALERPARRHEPRRPAAVAAVDGREPGREGLHLSQRVRRRLDGPGAGAEGCRRVGRIRASSTSRTSNACRKRERVADRSPRPRDPLANGSA